MERNENEFVTGRISLIYKLFQEAKGLTLPHLLVHNHPRPITESLMLRHERVLLVPRRDLPPSSPVNHPAQQDNDANHRIQPVRQTGIALAARRPQERRHEQEHLRGQVKRRDRPPAPERAMRVRRRVPQPEEPEHDKEVHHAAGVPLDVEDEGVRVAEGDGDDDDEGGDEVQQEPRAGRPQRPGRRPELRPGQHAFLGEFLVDARLREGDRHDVAERGDGDEDGQGARGVRAEDFEHEEGGDGDAGVGDLGGRCGREVGDVGEEVEDATCAEAEGTSDFKGSDGVADFVEDAGGVGPAVDVSQ